MHFHILYPEPDILTVYGPNNSTYWFMLFVRTDSITKHKCIYNISVLIEVLALLIGYVLHIRGFVIFWRLKAIHKNFLFIFAQFYSVMVVGMLGRLATIPYEARILRFSGMHEAPISFLAILRQSAYAQAFYIPVVLTIERTFATIYVADYEKNARMQISIILNSLIILASYATGYGIVTICTLSRRLERRESVQTEESQTIVPLFPGVLNVFRLTILLQIVNVSCALWFHWLLRYNERRLARLTDYLRRFNDEYSLSLRVQLKENIWSMKKIEFGAYFLTVGLALNMALIFPPILILTEPDQFETLQWFTCFGNLAFALAVLYTSPCLEVAIAIHKGRVPPILISIFGKEYFIHNEQKASSEIDSYFKQLDNQWSRGFDIRASRKITV